MKKNIDKYGICNLADRCWRICCCLVFGVIVACYINALYICDSVADILLPAPQYTPQQNLDLTAVDMSLPAPQHTPHKSLHLTLKEAILLALRRSPDVVNADLDMVINKFSMVVQRNTFLPQYSLSGNTTYTAGEQDQYSINPNISMTSPMGTNVSLDYTNDFDGTSGSPQVTIKQPLLQGFNEPRRQFQQSENDYQSNLLSYKSSIIGIVNQVTSSYYSLIEQYNDLKVQENTVKNAKNNLRQDEIKVKSGISAPSILVQDKVNVAQYLVQLTQSKEKIHSAKQELLQQLGLDIEQDIIIDKNIPKIKSHMPSYQQSMNIAKMNNIDYLQQKLALKDSEISLQSAKNSNLWGLNLTASKDFSRKSITNTSDGPKVTGDSTVDLQLSIPIHNLKNKQGLMEAKIGLEKQKNSLKNSKRTMELTVENDIQQIKSSIIQIQQAEQSLKLQKKT